MKILVVDDEPSIRDICSRALKGAGHEVLTADSGEKAAEMLADNWDIVLTDLTMPGSINGIEVVKRTKASGHADVMLMTAFPDLDTAIESMREGAYDYLIKPFSVDSLLLAIRRCAERRELSAELKREKFLRAELERAYFELNEMRKVEETFGQFATPEVARFVLDHPQDYWKQGERRAVTVLFADVRSFTSYAADASPEEAVEALNNIFARMIDVVQEEGGILNKFIGDGMLALFGAPVAGEKHARAAARAALKIKSSIEDLAQSRKKNNLKPLRVGIGINTGEVIAGCLGTKNRTEYSVIGHPVNVAARLEEAAREGQILVGPGCAQALEKDFKLRPLGPMKLAGISEPVSACELLEENPKSS